MPVELRCVRRTSRRTPPSRDAHRPNPNNLHRGGTTRRTSCPRVAPFIISDATGGVPGRAGRPAAGAIRGRGRRRAVVPGSRRRISHPYRAERPDEMVLVGEAAGWCPARSDVPRFAAHGGESHGQIRQASAAMALGVYADLFDNDLDEVGRAMDSLLRRENVAKMLPGSLPVPHERCGCAVFGLGVCGFNPRSSPEQQAPFREGWCFLLVFQRFSTIWTLPACRICLASSPISDGI